MTSYPLIITRNRHNSLLEAIVASVITTIISYGILSNLNNSRLSDLLNVLFVLICLALTALLWRRFFRKNQILVKIMESSVSFKKREVQWDAILSYRITEYTSSDGETTRHVYFKLKGESKEAKFYLPEYDISLDMFLKVLNHFAQLHKFSFEGISER